MDSQQSADVELATPRHFFFFLLEAAIGEGVTQLRGLGLDEEAIWDAFRSSVADLSELAAEVDKETFTPRSLQQGAAYNWPSHRKAS